jgi:hypothetical protein
MWSCPGNMPKYYPGLEENGHKNLKHFFISRSLFKYRFMQREKKGDISIVLKN